MHAKLSDTDWFRPCDRRSHWRWLGYQLHHNAQISWLIWCYPRSPRIMYTYFVVEWPPLYL